MFTLQDVLSLAQEKVSQAQDKVASSYDSGLTQALNSVGLQRKSFEEPKTDIAVLAGLFSAGLVTGVALSLLFAPKSGAEVRRSVRNALPLGDDDDDFNLTRYDLDSDRFRTIRRQRRSHRMRY